MRFQRLFTCGRFRASDSTMNWLTRRVSRKLELDNSQAEKLLAIQREVGRSRAELKTARQDRAKSFGELLAQEDFDREKAMDVMGDARQTLDIHAGKLIESFDEFHESLSTDQRQRLAVLWDRHMTKRAGCCHS